MDRTFPEIERKARQLLNRDFLYEHPESFRAGVLAAMQILAEQEARSEQDPAVLAHRARA